MLGRFALRGDRTLFLFVFAFDCSVPVFDVTTQKAILREQFGVGTWECSRILDELDRTEDLYFDRVSQIKMAQWSRGRIALVGDAAFCVSLMAGQGSALAITAAYVMAGELIKADSRHEEAFHNYEALLREYIGSKQKGAERFSSAFAPRTRWGLFVRNQVIKACAIPGLSKWAIGRDIIDKFTLPDYHWT
jgi:2-polyprenyl-6-methoxyphenol hydroxylase-like FAD-dependent oxidoreductase